MSWLSDCRLQLAVSLQYHKDKNQSFFKKKKSGYFQDIVLQLSYVSFLTSQRSHIIENSLYQCFYNTMCF